jgi:5-carboxymethyl-2-hydroxymuconate isomerase
MPHIFVEWTDNLEAEGFEIRPLLQLINRTMRDSDGVFPVGGIRVRGIRVTDYVIADDAGDYAFINVTVKIGAGRPADFKKAFFNKLFEVIKAHVADIYDRRALALSMYIEEGEEAAGFKHNNIHLRLKATA